MLELREGRARDQAPDVAPRGVAAQRAYAVGEAEPDWPMLLQHLAQRAIVDQRALDRGDATRRLQRLALHQHAAAGRARRPSLWAVHPGERVEHLEEIDIGRDQRALGEGVG